MNKHGTALVSGAYIELQTAVLKALPRNIDDDEALRLARNGEELTKFLSGLATNGAKESSILRLISGDENLVLPETDGKVTIAQSKEVFTGHLDSDFKNWGTDVSVDASGKMPVSVYEMEQDATFNQMFNSLSSDLDKLVIPQDKIVEFVKNYRNWLRTDGYATFFLFRVNGEYFVARVDFSARARLEVDVDRFEDDLVWDAASRLRVVTPQQKL